MTSSLLCTLGHVARLRDLQTNGVQARAIESALASGRIIRVRRGVYACAHVDAAVSHAARLGGALTCVSVLREAGVWSGHDNHLHVQLPPGALKPSEPGLRLHWEYPKFKMTNAWMAGPMQAVWRAIHCLDPENALATLESAVHEKYLTVAQANSLVLLAPRRRRSLLSRMITTSGSGNETLVRIRLEAAGHQVESQAQVPGLGGQDLLVDGCVAIEVDSHAWHDNPEQHALDGDRDLQSEALGRRVLRIRPHHIHSSWAITLGVIERVVQDARQTSERRVGRVIVRADDPL